MPERRLFYDRQGQPIDLATFNRLLGDYEYKVVAKTQVGAYEVSTVWLGIDHGWGEGAPVIFETMVFGAGHMGDLDCQRYTTEQDARQGHEDTVLLLRATVQEDPPTADPAHPRNGEGGC